MPVLFHRVAAVVVGTGGGRALRIDALDFSFTVVKNLRREPNTCSVEIYNLSDTSRLSIEGASGQQLRLEAGYANDSWAIFEGEVRRAWTDTAGRFVLAEISSGSGAPDGCEAGPNFVFLRVHELPAPPR